MLLNFPTLLTDLLHIISGGVKVTTSISTYVPFFKNNQLHERPLHMKSHLKECLLLH